MLERKIKKNIQSFFNSADQKALLITGARQVGKTYIIEEEGQKAYPVFVKINFIEDPSAKSLFENAENTASIMLRLSAVSGKDLIPGKTLIFFDEVQECKEIVTAIKYLVEDGRYKYILSGSLLGIELKDIRSVPVGYLDIIQMYPLDIEEFSRTLGVSDRIFSYLFECFENAACVDTVIHEKMMEIFRLYLITGGMPQVVSKYLETNNIREVVRTQQSIIALYKKDISKYDPDSKLYLEEIFDLIPSELNAKNKRFILKNLNENFKLSRYNNSFIWLKDAGAALPVYCASEPAVPLLLSKSTNLFKLFLTDVGLLAAMYMDDIQIKILKKETDINFGAVYENAAAQELKAHGYNLFYFNSKKQGEVDFLIEQAGEVIPIEIKSGKSYARHSALNNLLANPDYNINKAYVFYNENTRKTDKIIYYPIYMLMFLQKKQLPDDMVYMPDISILK